jgi:isopenicillin N synthase-like dioxygenase
MIMDVIPVVDFSAFPHGSDEEKRQAALAIDDAFQNAGFVYLINHGVSSDKVEECFEWVSHRSSIS